MLLMGYSGARGTLIYEKNLKAKISCQTPFKGRVDQGKGHNVQGTHCPRDASSKGMNPRLFSFGDTKVGEDITFFKIGT
jgi:hypothetical protein